MALKHLDAAVNSALRRRRQAVVALRCCDLWNRLDNRHLPRTVSGTPMYDLKPSCPMTLSRIDPGVLS
jgi:hypothetical protein